MTGDLYDTTYRMPVFVTDNGYYWNRLADYATTPCMTWTVEPDENPLKARRRRFQAFVATTRKPEPEWVPPLMVKPGKPVSRRYWGPKPREQRTR